MRSISMFIYIIVLSSFVNAIESKKAATLNTFKSRMYGFEFKYPDNWHLSTEPDLDTGQDIPIEDAGLLYIDIKNPTEACVKKDECHMGLIFFGDGTDKKYEETIKYFERFRKNEPGRNNKFVTVELNGNKTELLIRDTSTSEYGSYIYIYCEKNKYIANITAGRKYNSEVKSYTELKNRPITLENLFEKEQQEIIKSFKCPPADFVYKPEKQKK